MKYRQLGRTGVQVGQLALGTMNFGQHTPAEEAHTIMGRALDRGITLFDTADIYGGRLGRGVTEQIIGDWLTQDRSRRDRIVLATKVYGPMGHDRNAARLTALHLRKACEDSLRRLQTDRIDLLQMHHVDRATPWEETWQALELLVAQGKVLYVGSSNFAGWHLARTQERAERRGLLGLVTEQSVYNLMQRTVELEVLPACQAYGIGFLPYSPLGGGLLAGTAARAGAGQRTAAPKAKRLLEAERERLAAYEKWCGELGASPTAVALAWLLHQPGVTAPIVGPRTVEQFDGALAALKVSLDAAQLAELDAMFPGPGGAAPEAYAW